MVLYGRFEEAEEKKKKKKKGKLKIEQNEEVKKTK